MNVFLEDVGLICALGEGQSAVREGLFAVEQRGVAVRPGYAPEPTAVGAVTLPLPSLIDLPRAYQSRNNALLRSALGQIAPAVEAALEQYGPSRVAVVLGTSTSGIREGELALAHRETHGAWPDDYSYAQQEMSAPADFVARESGARGPAWVVSTACSSSGKAMASAARLLHAGLADAVITGGADALCRFTIAGFQSLESVSREVCNPFSRNRHGINIGEGAALFLMTRSESEVRLSGWGESSDAHHMSAPDPTARGALGAMTSALSRAGLSPTSVDYVNLHGTATPQNDAMESRAVAELLGPDVWASSTKPILGHALGAAGALEAAVCFLTLTGNPDGLLPVHFWDREPDPALKPVALVEPGTRARHRPTHVMSNSFAFGGNNVVLVLSRST
jgi:3-oxoacyl-[acyl-carrier-protein] synthase-1